MSSRRSRSGGTLNGKRGAGSTGHRPDQGEARRRRHEGHQPDQEYREDSGRGIGRPVPDRDGRSARSRSRKATRTGKRRRRRLDERLFAEIKRNEQRKKQQAEKGYDSLRYFVFTTLQEAGVKDADGECSAKVAKAFVDHPNWRQSEADLRELRKAVTFAVYAEKDDLDEVAAIVEKLLANLLRSAA